MYNTQQLNDAIVVLSTLRVLNIKCRIIVNGMYMCREPENQLSEKT